MDQVVEMFRAAQGGQGLENIAKLYGVSTQQALKVAETVMPAFTEGFRRASQSPESMGSLMALMTSGPYGALYNQPVVTNGMKEAGSDALNAVFGSSEVSRAVATQVAASTGLGVAVVKQMMPTYATLFLGGLAKSLAASGAMQQMLAAALSRMPGQTEARIAPISTGNPWMDAFAAFAAASVPQMSAPAPVAASPTFATGNPWADAFGRMMFQRTGPAAPAARQPGDAWQDVVNAMTQTLNQTTYAPAASAPPAPVPLRQVPTAAPALVPPPAAAAAPAMGAVNPLQPFQDFFSKMFTQGYPPTFPVAGASPFALPEFWMRMMTPPGRDDGTPRKG